VKGNGGKGGAAYQGDGGNDVWPGAVGTLAPLKACGTGRWGRRVVLGVQRPPTSGTGWRECEKPSGQFLGLIVMSH
jgi:hypothetical protein